VDKVCLDLFCKAGGSARGYARAGFRIIGVDKEPQPRYPYEFIQADANFYPLQGFDFIHASPPCHDHSRLAALHEDHRTGWMLDHMIARLESHGAPFIVENVENAKMPVTVKLCGTEFDLGAKCLDGCIRKLQRHRKFYSNLELSRKGPCNHGHIEPVGVYGHGSGGYHNGTYKANIHEASEAMGIDWMNKAELSQAVPPAYTEWLGLQILAQI